MASYTDGTTVGYYMGQTFGTATTPTADQVDEVIVRISAEIDELTQQSWGTAAVSGSDYEYHDIDRFDSWNYSESGFLYQFKPVGRYDTEFVVDRGIMTDERPIISVDSLEINSNPVGQTASWTSLTEDTDFIVYKDKGVIVFLTADLQAGKKRARLQYTYGKSTTPKYIEELATLMTARDIIYSKQFSSNFDTIDNISIESISITKGNAETKNFVEQTNDRINNLLERLGGMNKTWIV